MPKFKSIPTIKEAIQYTGESSLADMIHAWGEAFKSAIFVNALHEIEIYTLEGNHQVSKNDWVIKGIKGEFYPCKPDIFEKSYEPVDE